MSKLLISEPPLQVLPTLALRVGFNESIALQQLHYLLLDPNHGKKIAEHRWIFNTMEQWVCDYFPFWSVRTMRRVFASLAKQRLIIACQPEGRVSRRKYYRINTEELERISEGATLSSSMRPETAHPITKTSLQRKVEGGAHSLSTVSSFSPRYPYPTSETEMDATLELHGIDVTKTHTYDGEFFKTFQESNWMLRGRPVFDWIQVYEARLQVTSPKAS